MLAILGTLVGKIIAAVIGLVVVTGAVGGIAYAADVAIEADVIEKQCNLLPNLIVAKTRLFGITRNVEVDHQQCTIVPRDAYIQYHIRSGRTIIYQKEGGDCIWDTALGPCGVPTSIPFLTYQ